MLPIKFVQRDIPTYSGLALVNPVLPLYRLRARLKETFKPYHLGGDYHIGDILLIASLDKYFRKKLYCEQSMIFSFPNPLKPKYGDIRLHPMRSNGGSMTAEVARDYSAHLINIGPAGEEMATAFIRS